MWSTSHLCWLTFFLLCYLELVRSAVKTVYEVSEDSIPKWAANGNHRRNWVDGDYDGNSVDETFPTSPNETPANPRPYQKPGDWATPAPNSGINLGFTPVQTYIQVRRTNSVQRLPRSEAYKEASTDDEILNAHRLKEVLRTKKIQEVYSEEGYEDSGYDHGDEERHAEHGESFDKHKDGKFEAKLPGQYSSDVVNAESSVVENRNSPKHRNKGLRTGQRFEKTSMEVAYMPEQPEEWTTTQKPIERRKFNRIEKTSREVAYMPKQPEWTTTQKPTEKRKFKRANRYSSQKQKPLGTKRDFVSQKEEFWKFPSVFEDFSRGRQYNVDLGASVSEVKRKGDGNAKIKIQSEPPYSYIHSLTDAHFNGQVSTIRHKPRPIPSRLINLTYGFQPPSVAESKSKKRRTKRAEDAADSEKETVEYEKELSEELNKQKNRIIGQTFENLGIINDISEKFPAHQQLESYELTTSRPFKLPVTFDSYKYPYFNSKKINPYSPLRYASHPREFPRKSGLDMEFYESRDAAVECDPIDVSLDNEEKGNSTWHSKEQPGEKKRIVRLGDKIECLKMKYFGEDPLDNPFFKEEELRKAQDGKERAHVTMKYHSTYQYQPNRTLDVMIAEKVNDSNSEGTEDRRVKYETIVHHQDVYSTTERPQDKPQRIIPVSEAFLPELTTAAPIMGMRPPPVALYPFSIIRLPPKAKPKALRKKIYYKYNCLQPITKVTVTERMDEEEQMIFDCRDVMMVKTMRDGNEHYQIFPKTYPQMQMFQQMSPKKKRSYSTKLLYEDTERLRLGEVIEGNHLFSRKKRAAPATSPRKKSSLFPNKSLLDKIVRRNPVKSKPSEMKDAAVLDLGDRSPDELNIKSAQSTTTTARPYVTTTPASVPTMETIKLESRPLTRLSGRDFLVRYHKAKGSKGVKPGKKEFWKVESTTVKSKTNQKSKRDDTSVQSKILEPRPTPVLLYIVDEVTGKGQWIADDSTDLPSLVMEASTKKYVTASERKLKKQNARKNFFTKKLKKTLE